LARQWQYICDLEEEWENSNGKELENRPGGSAESRVVWYRELMGESFGMAAEWAVHRIFCGQGTGTVDLQRAGMEVQRALEEEHIRYWPWWMKGEWDEYALGGPC
jgi:hypothetical protein